MGLFSTSPKKADDKSIAPAANSQAPSSLTRVAGTGERAERPRVGIDHAIMLMRALPTDKHVDVVVTVLKTTLESLGIRVADIVADAAQRLQQVDARVTQLKGEIGALEQEIAKRSEEIARMEAARAETSKVKDYLETDDVEIVPSVESANIERADA